MEDRAETASLMWTVSFRQETKLLNRHKLTRTLNLGFNDVIGIFWRTSQS